MAKYTYHECECARQANAKVVVTANGRLEKVHFFRNSCDASMFFSTRKETVCTYALYWATDTGAWMKMFNL